MSEAALVRIVRAQFRLDQRGIHGVAHWARVRFHGVFLARQLDLDARVPRLFAVLHDSQRRYEGDDPEHGLRAADYADWLWRKGKIEIDAPGMRLLREACDGHSEGHLDADPVVQVCWDADRLDLGRVGIRPDPQLLCTSPARQFEHIERAWHWSRRNAPSTGDRASLVQPSRKVRRTEYSIPGR